MNDIHSKSNQLLTESQKGRGSAQPVGYDLHVTVNEMKESLNIVKVINIKVLALIYCLLLVISFFIFCN